MKWKKIINRIAPKGIGMDFILCSIKYINIKNNNYYFIKITKAS